MDVPKSMPFRGHKCKKLEAKVSWHSYFFKRQSAGIAFHVNQTNIVIAIANMILPDSVASQ